jgi:adenine deaminase
VLQKAIDLGFDPIKAIQMVTINPARHFYLDSYIGGIGLCKHADIVIIPDIRTIKAEYVISRGQVIARNGRATVHLNKDMLKINPLDKYINPVSIDRFQIHTRRKGPVTVRVMDQITDLITREAPVPMYPENGVLVTDPSRDLLKVSLITRQNKVVNAFIRGCKLKSGAIASTNSWENFGIIAVGTDDREIACVVNHVLSIGGGIAVCREGDVLASLALPIGGLISDLPIEEIVRRLLLINDNAHELGFPFDDVPKMLAVLTTPAIPFLRLSEDGLFDLKTNKLVSLIID